MYLGVDPSTRSTGYAVFDDKKELVEYGTIEFKKEDAQIVRVEQTYDRISEIMNKHGIASVFCEDQFAGPNMDTLKKLSQIRAVIMLAAAKRGADFTLVYPSEWRKVFHGYGSANKQDALDLANAMFNLTLLKKENDIADAIGIGYTGTMEGEAQ